MMKSGAILGFLCLALGGCGFILGPDEPVDRATGNLIINVGTAGNPGRAISSGVDLPGDVLDALRYEFTLAGPEGKTLEEETTAGRILSRTVAIGDWRVDIRAYQDADILAGTGSASFTVEAGINSIRVPMDMEGVCYEIEVDSAITNGAVVPNFSAAFPGTTITLSVTPDSGYTRSVVTLIYNDGTADVVIPAGSYAFTMPAADVRVSARLDLDADVGFDW
jgi:hypothetical protein